MQLMAATILDIAARGLQIILLYRFDFDFITPLFGQQSELNMDKKNEIYSFAFIHENEKRRLK